ncbi:MAG TPA: cupin domain-containing protein [Mycobacteriales bacterium]|jgi:quercetin dioxygenase-like cupin family protein|nr:cupin domain-containing protein [Mycobacteriales bacterium]
MPNDSLIETARQQLANAQRTPSGRSAETMYGGHERVLRQTVLALVAGQSLSEHDNPGEATICVLAGRVRITSGELSWAGVAGDLIVVPATPHRLHADEDSAVLLTVAKTR